MSTPDQPIPNSGNNDLNAPPPYPGDGGANGGGRNPLALAVVAIIAAGMLYFGFHMARRPGPSHPIGMGYGTPAPDFTLETVDGKSMQLSELRGKAVLLNFWA